MKKRKSILVSIAALALIAVGTGYAYWTDGVSITTKAETGELDVAFVDMGYYYQYKNDTVPNKHTWAIFDGMEMSMLYAESPFANQYGKGDGATGGLSGDSMTDAGFNDFVGNNRTADFVDADHEYVVFGERVNSIQFGARYIDPIALKQDSHDYKVNKGNLIYDEFEVLVNNIYPGYAQGFRSDIINQGTIPVLLDTVELTLDMGDNGDNKDLEYMLGVSVLVDEDDNETKIVDLKDHFEAEDIFTVGGVEFVRYSAVKGQKIDVDSDIELRPGVGALDSFDVFYTLAMDPDATDANSTEATESSEQVKLSVDFTWQQFNAPVTPEAEEVQ